MSDMEDFAARIAELQAKFKEKGAKCDTNVKKGLMKAALVVQAYAQEHMSPESPSSPYEAPAVVTGTLKASITSRVEDGEDGPFAMVGTNVEYAGFLDGEAKGLEFGTSKMAPRPFMNPALTINHGKIVEILADSVKEALE